MRPTSLLLGSFLAAAAFAPAADQPASKRGGAITLTLRSRVEAFKGSGEWHEVTFSREFVPAETALLLCDVWDEHWCQSASRRCEVLARRMAPVVEAARAAGVTIVHAPSECMDFYKDHPARKRALSVPRVEPPKALSLPDPPLPVDDSDGGCDDEKPGTPRRAWTRQHAAVPVADTDFISDSGPEVYSVLKSRGVKNLFIMGVHTNMCVLNRTFAIKQMTRWGVRCVLVRDLTDTMYNPKRAPFVAHEEGTELVVRHIEKHWCPTAQSAELLKKLRP